MNYYEIVISVLEKWYASIAQATPRLIVGIIVFFIILMLSSYLSKITVRIFHRFFPKSKNTSFITLVKVFKFLIILAGTFIAFEIMGFGGFVIKFIGSLGVAGVIAGVALKDLVSSMFSGALIGIDKAFAVGDNVSIKDVSGVVESIGFLTTKIITDEGKKVYVPNQLIFSSPFVNNTASVQRKLFLDLQIASSQDLEKAIQVIIGEIKTFDFADHIDQAEVFVQKQNFGIFYRQIRFSMKVGENMNRVRSTTLLRLKKKLEDHNIELATQPNDASN